MKVFGIEGKTLLEDVPDSHTFDYAMINHPIFFANTLKHYVFIQAMFANLGVAPKTTPTPAEKEAAIHRFFYGWVTGKGTLPPEQWAWEELGAFLQLTQHKYVNLLLSTYWTTGAYFLFISAQAMATIEFLQQEWINDGNFIGIGDERDPIIGLQEDEARFTIPKDPVRRLVRGIETFNVLRGGEYFFMPSISALNWIANLT